METGSALPEVYRHARDACRRNQRTGNACRPNGREMLVDLTLNMTETYSLKYAATYNIQLQ